MIVLRLPKVMLVTGRGWDQSGSVRGLDFPTGPCVTAPGQHGQCHVYLTYTSSPGLC